jgi:hypothetical protein
VRSQSFPAICTASPERVIHPFRTTTPRTMNGTPSALTAPSTFGATRCRGGTGTSFRFAQTVSPSTPLDAQWSSERGGGNALGLITAHAHTRPTGTSDRQPIRLRVQIAATSSGGTGMRV